MNRKSILYRSGRWVFVIAIGVIAFVVNGTVAEEQNEADLSVSEIIHKSNHVSYYSGEDGRAKVTMTIVDEQEKERNREFTILRRDEPAPEEWDGKEPYCGDQRYYVYFKRPADVNEMVFMVWKHVDRKENDDRWLYMPAMDLVKRIAASDKRTSFVGSNFFYEDVSGRNPNLDEHSLMKTTDKFYVLKSEPKRPEKVAFQYYKTWVHKASFIPVKQEYYKQQGEAYRVYQVLEVEEIQGHKTVMKSKMVNKETGGHTVLEYEDVAYDVGIPKSIFTERYLRRAPRKYLK